ncbi:hypothetical protein Bhyg_08003, partial [Pseudolycoriella hygida]
MEHFNRKQIEEMKKLLAVGKVPTNANPHLIFAAAKALFVDGLKFDLRPGWFVDLETRTEPFHEVPDLGRETYKIYKEFFDDEKKGPQRRRNYVVDSRAHFIDYREENGNCVCGDKPCTFNNSLRPRDPEGVNEQLPDDFNMDNIQPVGVDNLVRPRDPGGVNEQLPDDFDMGNVQPVGDNNLVRPRDPEGVNEQLPDDFDMGNVQPVGDNNLVRPRDPEGVNEQLPDDFDMGNVQPVGDNNLVRPRDPEGVNEQLPDDFDMGNVQPVGDNSLVPPLHLEGVNEQLADDFDNGRARPPIYQPIAIEESRCHRRRRRRRPRTMLLINPDIMTQASITGMHENPTDDDDNG